MTETSVKPSNFHPNTRDLLSLDNVKSGETVILKHISRPRLVLRFAEMGFLLNNPLTVAMNKGKGPILIESNEIKLMIGRGIAKKMLVE